MSGDGKIAPPIKWAQRNDKIYLTICIEDCKDEQLDLQENKLIFRGKGGVEKKDYEVTLEFNQEINPKESKFAILAREIPMVIKKKEEGPYWPRLLKEAGKKHWLKTDFNKWKDEDDSDTEADNNKDMQLEDMMKQMGNFNTADAGAFGGGPEGEGEEDSDDEELPDLE